MSTYHWVGLEPRFRMDLVNPKGDIVTISNILSKLNSIFLLCQIHSYTYIGPVVCAVILCFHSVLNINTEISEPFAMLLII